MKGCITRRGERSWRLKFEAGERDPATGKRQTRFVTIRGTKKEAERELIKLLNQVEEGTFIEPTKQTVAEHLRYWLANHAKLSLAPKTFERYTEIIEKHLIPALGAIQLRKLHSNHIQKAWTEALAAGRRDGKGGLAPRTVLHHHRLLSEALDQAVKSKVLSANPMAAVDAPKPPEAEIEVVTEAELATLIRASVGRKQHTAILLAATTGMRRGEILALAWKHVDLEGATLKVTRSLEHTKAGGLRFKEPKSKAGRRTITLPSLAVEALRKHRAAQAAQRLRLGKLYNADHDLVFAKDDGEPIDPRHFSKEFSNFAAKIEGVPPITFHGLRHSHITHLLDAGINPKVVSERAGHATVAITLTIYAHVLKGRQEGVAAKVDAALRTALEQPATLGCQSGANEGVVTPIGSS